MSLRLCLVGVLSLLGNVAEGQDELRSTFVELLGRAPNAARLDEEERAVLHRLLVDAIAHTEPTPAAWARTHRTLIEEASDEARARFANHTRTLLQDLAEVLQFDANERLVESTLDAWQQPSYRYVFEVECALLRREQRRFAEASQQLDALWASAPDAAKLPELGRMLVDEARIFVGWERAVREQQRGLVELAVGHWMESDVLARQHAETYQRLELWAESQIKGLDLAAASDAFDMSESIAARCTVDPRWANVPLEFRFPFTSRLGGLRLLAERRGRPPGARTAAATLEDALALAPHNAPADERLRAHTLLTTALLDQDDPDLFPQAEESLEQARALYEQLAAMPSADASALRPFLIRIEDEEIRLSVAWDPALPDGDLLYERARDNFQRILDDAAERTPREAAALLEIDPYLRVVQHFVDLAIEIADDPAEDVLDAIVRLHDHGALARTIAEGAPGRETVRSFVPEDGGLLALLPGLERCYAVVVDTAGASIEELPAIWALEAEREQLEDAIRRFLRSPRPSEDAVKDVEQAAHALSDRLFTPSMRRRMQNWDALGIVGAPSFGEIPFELLPWSDTETTGQRFAVGFIPSFSVASALSRRASAEAPKFDARAWVSVDAPALDGGRTPLVFGRDERALLRGPWSDTFRAEIVHGPSASLQRLRSPAAATHAMILVAHGDPVLTEHGRSRALRLWSEDGLGGSPLRLDDAGELELAPWTLVFACGAMSGPIRRGDEGSGSLVGRLLAESEVRCLVMSAFEVEYRGALRVAGELTHHLSQGLSAAHALREVRRATSTTTQSPRQQLQRSLFHAIGLPFDRR